MEKRNLIVVAVVVTVLIFAGGLQITGNSIFGNFFDNLFGSGSSDDDSNEGIEEGEGSIAFASDAPLICPSKIIKCEASQKTVTIPYTPAGEGQPQAVTIANRAAATATARASATIACFTTVTACANSNVVTKEAECKEFCEKTKNTNQICTLKDVGPSIGKTENIDDPCQDSGTSVTCTVKCWYEFLCNCKKVPRPDVPVRTGTQDTEA
jgi:hypothetical protein